MGRFYSGDIEGKFWVGVQASDSASRFGGEEYEPSFIEYYFDENDLKEVQEELKAIEDKLGDWLKKLDDFFDDNASYNDHMLVEYGVPKEKIVSFLSDYADYYLGKKIEKALLETGECRFEAEL